MAFCKQLEKTNSFKVKNWRCIESIVKLVCCWKIKMFYFILINFLNLKKINIHLIKIILLKIFFFNEKLKIFW